MGKVKELAKVFRNKSNTKDCLQLMAEESEDPTPALLETPGVKKPFQCSGCGKQFYTRRGWEKGHLPCIGKVDLSLPRTIPCPKCSKLFQEEKDMLVHMGDKHKNSSS